MRISGFLLLTFLVCMPFNGMADDDATQQGWQDQGPELILTPSDSSDSSEQFQDEPISASVPEVISMSSITPSPHKPKPTIAFHSTAKPHFYGPITSEEHIWKLSQKLRSNDSVTVQQMMVGLLRANPNAFSENNINSLKVGTILQVPSLVQIRQISPELAHQIIQAQNLQWHKLQKNSQGKLNFSTKTLIKTPKIITIPTTPTTVQPTISITLLPATQFTPIQNTQEKPPTVVAPDSVTTNLQQEVITTQQELEKYKDQINTEMINLEKQNAAMQSRLLQDEKIVSELTQKNITTNANNSAAPVLPNQLSAYLPKSKVGWWIMWAMLFIIVLIWMPSGKREVIKRQEPVVHTNADETAENDIKFEDEYDFMNSQEALPAKLDLARAYIDMEDFSSAEMLLKEVMEKGASSERKQAMQLLKTIKVTA